MARGEKLSMFYLLQFNARLSYFCNFCFFFQKKCLVRNPSDIPGIHATPGSALQLLPPVAYAHQPAVSFAIKFAGQAPSKTRSSVNVAVWTPDGRRCLTGTQGGEFCMWDGHSFQFETIIQAHETPVRSMVFTHSGNFLISGDDAGNVRYWRTNLELVKSSAAHRESVRQLAFSPTDLKFATASDDSTVRVWDFARVTTEHVLAGHGGDVRAVDWHPSKSILVSGSKDALVKLWCPRSGRVLGTMQGHKGTVTAAQWNQNGNWVLTGSRDQTCKVYDIRMQAELATFTGHGKDITQVAWHSLQEELFVSGGTEGSLCFWLAGRPGPQAELSAAHEGSIFATAWHPSGHLLATGGADAATKFWCRCRPGDPFFEQQQEEQAELAALVESAAAPAKTFAAPALFAPPPVLAAGGGGMAAIPGIGEAVARQVVAAPDMYAMDASMDVYAGGGPRRYDDEPHRRRSRSRSPIGRDEERRGGRHPRGYNKRDRSPSDGYHHRGRPPPHDRERPPRSGGFEGSRGGHRGGSGRGHEYRGRGLGNIRGRERQFGAPPQNQHPASQYGSQPLPPGQFQYEMGLQGGRHPHPGPLPERQYHNNYYPPTR